MITIKIQKANKCQDEYSMFLTFPYNADIIDLIHALPTRYWNKDEKTWEVPLKKLNYLVEKLQRFGEIEIKADNMDWAKEKEFVVPSNFQYKTQPYQHQIDGFNYGFSHDKWLLADEQGLGKTKEVIDIAVAKKLANGYKHCLILCGVNGLKWNWYNEVLTHSNEQPYILGQKVKKDKLTVGGNADKMADIQAIGRGELADKYFIITNVETLRNEGIVNELKKLCDKKIIQMIAFDEFHRCKDSQSLQGKGILKLTAETLIAMTGTPVMNNPLDLFVVLKWLGYEEHTFYAFKNYYCEMGGYGNYQIIGYKHLDQIQNQLNDMMLRRLKKDVLDLPEKIMIDEYVEMSARQAQIYKEVSMDIQANIDQIKSSSNPLAEMIRLRQATGYTGILSSMIKESAKLDRMEELVDDAIQNGKQVVIFSNWTQITDEAYRRIAKNYKIGQITGQTKDDERQNLVKAFQNGKLNVMIGTIGAMGTGITLTAGTVEIFLDHPWTQAAYDQSVDRCHRIGQKDDIMIYNLLTRGTIDERIWELVKKKGRLANALVDNAETMDKGRLVDFLLS